MFIDMLKMATITIRLFSCPDNLILLQQWC